MEVGHADWRNEVRNELLELPDINLEDVVAAVDEADANGCTYFYLILLLLIFSEH